MLEKLHKNKHNGEEDEKRKLPYGGSLTPIQTQKQNIMDRKESESCIVCSREGVKGHKNEKIARAEIESDTEQCSPGLHSFISPLYFRIHSSPSNMSQISFALSTFTFIPNGMVS